MVKTIQTGRPIDFSFIPSFKCNIRCWFCMYDCGPDNKIRLDYQKTVNFAKQIDWSLINTVGFYGGEPSIEMEFYDKFIALVPEDTPRFVITNGTWSTDIKKTINFLEWCIRSKFHVLVSGTHEHVIHQDKKILKLVRDDYPDCIRLKEPDEIHAQGRAAGHKWVINDCNFTCQRTDRNMRLGLKPDGKIIFQNCHGEYLVVQTYDDPFAGIYDRAHKLFSNCYLDKK